MAQTTTKEQTVHYQYVKKANGENVLVVHGSAEQRKLLREAAGIEVGNGLEVLTGETATGLRNALPKLGIPVTEKTQFRAGNDTTQQSVKDAIKKGVEGVDFKRRFNPAWVPPASIREEDPELPEMIPAGAENPLGQYALSLGWQNYVIHGTNRPHSVGKRSSHGCVRLYPEDIAQLFKAVEVGTQVTVIDTPYKLGWKGNQLFLEVTPTQAQTDFIVQNQHPMLQPLPEISDIIQKKAGENTRINWEAVGEALVRQNGIPVVIGEKAASMQHRQLFLKD